jgi:hypothetical protein
MNENLKTRKFVEHADYQIVFALAMEAAAP